MRFTLPPKPSRSLLQVLPQLAYITATVSRLPNWKTNSRTQLFFATFCPGTSPAHRPRSKRIWHWRPAPRIAGMVALGRYNLRSIVSSALFYIRSGRPTAAKDCPEPRPACPPGAGKIIAFPRVGGLHHRYERLAA